MKERKTKLSIYVIVVLSVLIIGTPLVYMCTRVIDRYTEKSLYVENAYLDATSYAFVGHKPLCLTGEWNVYHGLSVEDDYSNIMSEYDHESVWLPTRDLEEAKQDQVYQMFLAINPTEIEQGQLYLSIPMPLSSSKVYMNGHFIPNTSYDDSWLHLRSENGLFFVGPYYDESLEYQEILITVPHETSVTNLYNREISVSTYSNYVADEKVRQSLQLLLIGMMLTVILVGFSYMILVPSNTMLTLMNLFDAAMMLHILFNMSTIPNVAMATITRGDWGCYQFRQLDLGFFMIAGTLACLLGKEIFDPENKAHKIFDKPVIAMYAVMGIILAIKPELLDSEFVLLIVGVTLFAFVCLIARIRVCIKEGQMNSYGIFHVCKSVYIGSVIFIDLASLTADNRNNIVMLILYANFFFVHLFIKAYDYRLLFRNLEVMNVQLEATVAERTMELQLANNELQDISVRDALTRCYNRMHFEAEFSSNVQKLRDGISNQFHLCMLDLDGFKSINDTYGHAEGDEQLIETVQIVLNHVDNPKNFARIGGEEFAVLFVNQEDEQVLEVIEAIRCDLEELSRKRMERTTGSFGVYKAKTSDEGKTAYSNADHCLYYSKEHGKNQITYDFGNGMETYRKVAL